MTLPTQNQTNHLKIETSRQQDHLRLIDASKTSIRQERSKPTRQNTPNQHMDSYQYFSEDTGTANALLQHSK